MSTEQEPRANNVVILDNDPTTPLLIEQAIKRTTTTFSDPEQLTEHAAELNPVGAFIALYLESRVTGLDILPTLKKNWPFTPILIITDSFATEPLSQAFGLGAADFLHKPLIPGEIHARFNISLAETTASADKKNIEFGDITINLGNRIVTGPKGKRYVSPTEISLLKVLAQTDGVLIDKEQLKLRCWGQLAVTDNALHRKLHTVRQLLRDVSDNVVVQTKYGSGFCLKSIPNLLRIAS